ncbi:helix-turn-helix domain-containing protein [Clostridium sp. AL.422]|uniref:helix-turn-helix domain-containing protein n=1 Tax=Clostridium TaxID=1485 RepID=UPI00293DB617|nr:MULTISPECIES: helix-turn-helix domain-containing protein [unclassified Clostridium]MDV4152734.1 helix-turn-helix domain-containing protein [Clostridium sp. AL.422]
MVKKYRPSALEYLRFEQECGSLMNKEARKTNRKKYRITEEDIHNFYGYNKKSDKKQNKNDITKQCNITKKDADEMCKIFNKVFDTEKECFVRLRCAESNIIYAYNVQDLKDNKKLFNILNSNKFRKEDFFYSLATYKTMLSGEEDNIFSMHLISIDIDFRKVKRLKDKTPMQIFEMIKEQEFDKNIPAPNYFEVGHQLRLLYKIQSVGATKLSKNLVKRINKVFNERMIDYGGDTPRLTDYARIKGSINTKDNSIVDIFILENVQAYKLKDLQEKWLNEIPSWYLTWKNKKHKGKIVKFRPKDKSVLYPLNMGRIEDFKKIAAYYGKDLDGRRFLCFLVRNHSLLAGFSEEEAKEMLREFNNNLAKPLSWRVIERDTRNVNKKQYLYKDITILDYLGIGREEVNLIGLEEIKYQTDEEKALKKLEYNKEYMFNKFRNSEGLTKTEVKRRAEFIQIAELELNGLSLREIAVEIGKSVSTISEKINKKYKRINYNEIKEMIIELKVQGIKILA